MPAALGDNPTLKVKTMRDWIDRTGKPDYRPAIDTRSCRLPARPKSGPDPRILHLEDG